MGPSKSLDRARHALSQEALRRAQPLAMARGRQAQRAKRLEDLDGRLDAIYAPTDLVFARLRGDLERRLLAEREALTRTIAKAEVQEVEPLRKAHLEVRVREEAVTKLIERRRAERQAKSDKRESEQLDLAGARRFTARG